MVSGMVQQHKGEPRGWVPQKKKKKNPPPPPPPPPTCQKGYQKFPLSKLVVGQYIALHAVPAYRAFTYLVSGFLAHSTSFSLNFFNPQWWNVCGVL